MAVCRPAVSIDVHVEFCLVLLLLLGVCLLSKILSQCEALQTKQSTLETQILDISIRLFCKGHILVDPNNSLLSLAGIFNTEFY